MTINSQTTSDIIEISQALYRMLRCSDNKAWDEWLNYFADELTIDFGGVKPAQLLKPGDLAAWGKLAYALVKTQHMVFNLDVVVEGDTANSTACGHALHQRTDTGDSWHIYPRYEHSWIRINGAWKIKRLRMTPVFEEGNPKLLEESYAAALEL